MTDLTYALAGGTGKRGRDRRTRITYKSQFGDYGINQEWENLHEYELIHLLANKLGKFEDAEERDENNAAE
jgi:hypothetical protein